MSTFEMIVIGSSYGGIQANHFLVPALSAITTIPMIIVQHTQASHENPMAEHLNSLSRANVKEASHGMSIQDGHVYIAPGGYHLLGEENKTLSLSIDDPVHFSRPSIDVLFESIADVYQENLIVILLTGASDDGAAGLAYAHQLGAFTIAQDPSTAKMPIMPQAAIDTGEVDVVLDLKEIPQYINKTLNSVSINRGGANVKL
jgi:two-component system chemotaxis response regulator CheB